MTPAALPNDWPFRAQSSLVSTGRHPHTVATTTPTGHIYTARAPDPP